MCRMRGWRRCWTISAEYVGSSPYLAPAVLCSIGDMQATEGVWYPKGGTRAVAVGLAKLAADLGADLRPGVEVTGFDIENGAVRAVKTASGERIACDAVISNMDAIRTYKEAGRRRDRPEIREEGVRAGLFRRRALSRPAQALRASGAPLLRLLPRCGGGVRRDLQEGRPGARPDRLSRGALLFRRHRGAGGRGGAVRAGAHAASAARARLGEDVPPTARPSSTS
ncbi:phytoene desaturase family protein [Dankookia sp. P2]|uniref:phytoene desaturase family protein n=1 Tax=Dankookia sp. P2 TaxID=3423955 RepID=UPI003D6659CA